MAPWGCGWFVGWEILGLSVSGGALCSCDSHPVARASTAGIQATGVRGFLVQCYLVGGVSVCGAPDRSRAWQWLRHTSINRAKARTEHTGFFCLCVGVELGVAINAAALTCTTSVLETGRVENLIRPRSGRGSAGVVCCVF